MPGSPVVARNTGWMASGPPSRPVGSALSGEQSGSQPATGTALAMCSGHTSRWRSGRALRSSAAKEMPDSSRRLMLHSLGSAEAAQGVRCAAKPQSSAARRRLVKSCSQRWPPMRRPVFTASMPLRQRITSAK